MIGGWAAVQLYLRLLRDPLACLGEVADAYGDLCIVGVPFRPQARRLVFALGQAHNRAVLSDPETFRTTGQGLSGPRGSALRRVRNGLTRTRGEKHRRLRAQLLPRLQRRAVEAMAPAIARVVDEQLAGWQTSRTLDLTREAKALSLRISSEVLFGIEDRAQAAKVGRLLGEFMQQSYRLDVLATRRLAALPLTPYAALERHAQRLEQAMGELIRARRGSPGEDLFSALIEACDAGIGGLTEEDLVGQATLLFGASYETTAQAFLFTLALLAQSPSVARALREALAGPAIGADPGAGTRPGPDVDSERPELLAFVVRESLRVLPPVPYTIRIATRDVQLGGAELRRSDRVLISHFHAHRSPACFPEPERFLPDRWRDARPGPYDYFPFSAAPRLCIGAGFATEVLEQAVAAVVERFDFRLPEGLRIEPAVRVTLGTRSPVRLEIEAPGHGFRAARLRGRLGRLIEAAGEGGETGLAASPAAAALPHPDRNP